MMKHSYKVTVIDRESGSTSTFNVENKTEARKILAEKYPGDAKIQTSLCRNPQWHLGSKCVVSFVKQY